MTDDRAEARTACEHFYASHCYRGMSIRLCTTCHEPDWDDLAEQLAEAKLATVPEYRVLVDEDGDVVLLGPCAETIGCLFQVTYDGIEGVTLGVLAAAAVKHEGAQGERAHAFLAEINSEVPGDG